MVQEAQQPGAEHSAQSAYEARLTHKKPSHEGHRGAQGAIEVDLGAAKVVAFDTHARVEAGRTTFEKEMRMLIASDALPFHKALGRDEAARVAQIRFVYLKAIMAIKNSEMPAEHRNLKC